MYQLQDQERKVDVCLLRFHSPPFHHSSHPGLHFELGKMLPKQNFARFSPLPCSENCNICTIKVKIFSSLHLFWWFTCFFIITNVYLEHIANKSSIVKSSFQYFDFLFSIATVFSSLLWWFLARWSWSQTKYPFTPSIYDVLSPLQSLYCCPAYRLF